MVGESEQRRRFAYALRRTMEQQGVSVRALADKLDMDPRRITRWLQALDLPTLYEGPVLAKTLKVREEFFLNPPEVPPPPPVPYYPVADYIVGAVEWGAKQGLTRPLPVPKGNDEPESPRRQSRRRAAQ